MNTRIAYGGPSVIFGPGAFRPSRPYVIFLNYNNKMFAGGPGELIESLVHDCKAHAGDPAKKV
eukprot:1134371-Pelagomonas_calceolata.AAC.2